MVDKLPLTGTRVLDLSRLLPGPYCTMLLADLGADVVKVEEPGRGDYMRDLIPSIFQAVNRNKRSIVLDFKQSDTQNVVQKLAERTDIFVESFRPGVAERLGLGYSRMKEINPGIIYCSISGYGQQGPYRDRPGHDINYLGLAGALSVPGEINKKPARPGLPIADLSSGLFAALAILSAFIAKERNGKGQYIDVAMIDILVSWMSVRAGDFLLGGLLPKRPTEMSHLSPSNAVFLAKDKKGISIGALEDVFWKKLCKVLEIDHLFQNDDFSSNIKRVKQSRKIYAILRKAFAQKDRAEWIGLLDQAGVPCGPVYFYDETFEDLHIRNRELFFVMPYRGKKLKQVRFPAIFSDLRPKVYLPPPEVGEHTKEVLRETGFSSANIKRLGEQGVFGLESFE